jgi:hypothetical protein
MIVIPSPARNLAFTLFLSFGLLLTAHATWAAAPTDLGQGLVYCRVHTLPADLPAASTGKSDLVLDLRYTLTDDTGATAFSAWLGFRTATEPVFILVNAGTSPALVHALALRPQPSGIVALGPPLPAFTPDVPLKISPDTERRAYDAFDHGTAIESLTVEKIDKPRYDEASMVKDHASDSEPPAPDDEDDAIAKPDSAKAKPAPPPQLIDLALQRAVQLHRALLALHKIPRA